MFRSDFRQASSASSGSPTAGEGIGIVFDIKRYAIHDGPGIRTTVFFKGCPLRCRWCQNPESWEARPEPGLRASRCESCGQCSAACPHGAIVMARGRPVTDSARCDLCGTCLAACGPTAREIIGRRVSVGDVATEIEKDVVFYDESGGGVTFSGGEPLMQADFLRELLRRCKSQGIQTAVDTSCYAEPAVLDGLCQEADLFLCDVKHMDSAAHHRMTGVGNEVILDNIRRLGDAGAEMIIRVPAVPDFNDEAENLDATGRFAASLRGVRGLDILPYNGGGRGKSARLTRAHDLLDLVGHSDEQMDAMAGRLRRCGLDVRIGGRS